MKKIKRNTFDVNKIWIYKIEDCCCGIVIADDKASAREKVIDAYLQHYTEFDPDYAVIQIENALENGNIFEDCPAVIEVDEC